MRHIAIDGTMVRTHLRRWRLCRTRRGLCCRRVGRRSGGRVWLAWERRRICCCSCSCIGRLIRRIRRALLGYIFKVQRAIRVSKLIALRILLAIVINAALKLFASYRRMLKVLNLALEHLHIDAIKVLVATLHQLLGLLRNALLCFVVLFRERFLRVRRLCNALLQIVQVLFTIAAKQCRLLGLLFMKLVLQREQSIVRVVRRDACALRRLNLLCQRVDDLDPLRQLRYQAVLDRDMKCVHRELRYAFLHFAIRVDGLCSAGMVCVRVELAYGLCQRDRGFGGLHHLLCVLRKLCLNHHQLLTQRA
mmetsp:Transcript_25473/g.41553  ORF Transcript_25473/g.41553 Transcript_25473/m.41553 type:complete len:306 (+) Transcript_25473:871-1788(+)